MQSFSPNRHAAAHAGPKLQHQEAMRLRLVLRQAEREREMTKGYG